VLRNRTRRNAVGACRARTTRPFHFGSRANSKHRRAHRTLGIARMAPVGRRSKDKESRGCLTWSWAFLAKKSECTRVARRVRSRGTVAAFQDTHDLPERSQRPCRLLEISSHFNVAFSPHAPS
jgi:hypothetical protein